MFELNGKLYTPVRLKLRRWIEFEHIQQEIGKAIRDQNVEEYERKLCILISFVLEVSEEEILHAPWYEQAQAYTEITNVNQVKRIPIVQPSHESGRPVPWDYEGRTWFWWIHILSKNYGWSIAQVEELDIDEATALLQEILVEEQLRKEWEWSLTEIAYPYNSTTKKSVFHPLDRPAWMRGVAGVPLPAQKVRFHKHMIPVGRIIGEDGNERIVN